MGKTGEPDTDTVRVDNPLHGPSSPEEHRRIDATRTLRDDPLARLHSRRQISAVEYQAGRRWQELYEASQITQVGSLDPGREYVDTSYRHRDGITDRQRAAQRRLKSLAGTLGRTGAIIVSMVLAERLSLCQAAARLGEGWRDKIVSRFRECLRTIGEELGLSSKKENRK